MTRSAALAVLLLAALLEAGGDAVMRAGIRTTGGPFTRALLFAAGAVVLSAYGWTVNAPGWDFGRLLGIYVVFFFVIAQLISWLAFSEPPGRAVLIGGAFIVTGGCLVAML